LASDPKIRVVKVSASPDLLEFEIGPSDLGNTIEARLVRLPRSDELSGVVTLTTDSPEAGEIKLPFYFSR
jgi:hypothetical protein